MANAMRRPASSWNWALWTGLLMALIVLLMAFVGPMLAPADPMKENYIGQVGERFIKPPFPPNTIEGFPLGSDEWGRDLLSRLLFAIKPTMTLVLVVAAVRLVIGIAAGMISGWSRSWFSRVLDVLISASLTIPVLFVALFVIALMGSRWGVWAFILGLAITGWAEPARIVREQTRGLKSQAFVEAAYAMGASPEQGVLSHVLPHVLPMMWIQLAFEVAGSLLVTASLGFLGYFMNGIWVPVGDWVGQRTAGMPELGEMLGSATTQRVPWSALFAGALVALIVLAFNLLGEGLRAQLNPDRQRRRADMTLASARAGAWVEDKVYVASANLMRLASGNGVVVLLGVVIIGGIWTIQASQPQPEVGPAVSVQGGHFWPVTRHDPQGTYWTGVEGPRSASLLWRFQSSSPITSGPVVDALGRLYVGTQERELVAVSPSGQVLWKVELPDVPFGSPALAGDGSIFVVDASAGISSVSPEGKLNWSAKYTEGQQPFSGPVLGVDGTAYYGTTSRLVAVYPSGNLRFLVNLPTYSLVDFMPRLSADGRYLFMEDTVTDTDTGSLVFDQTQPPMDAYFVGSDAVTYLRGKDGIDQWEPTDTGYVLIQKAKVDARLLGTNLQRPQQSGVSPGGNVWIVYSSGFDAARFVWINTESSAVNIIPFPSEQTRLIGIDQSGAVYTCGEVMGEGAFCRSNTAASGELNWQMDLPEGAGVVDGAIAPNRLYVTVGPFLYAIGGQ
ncbi:MAG: ABC transporter permease subunit [Anaerolineae bacterium]|nr:ABC transporter permease subunit [Anaerolineae bacterium]